MRGFDSPIVRQTQLKMHERKVKFKCIAWRPLTSKTFMTYIARAVDNIFNLSFFILYFYAFIYVCLYLQINILKASRYLKSISRQVFCMNISRRIQIW